MKKLLIVDDNPDIVDIIKEYLSDMYDLVIAASTVDQAQDYVCEHKFTMITLDINLHGRNGSEVIKFIMDAPTNENKTTPIVLISGMMTEEFIMKNRNRFAGVLVKPFDMNALRWIAEDVNKGNHQAKNRSN